MPARYMLDTNICIHIRQKRPPEILNRFRSLRCGEAVISVITFGELRYGAEKSRERERAVAILDELVRLIPVQPMPLDAALAYGSIRASLESRGEVIGNNDLWIAAHAHTAELTLVTNNEREFQRVPGLSVENWAR
jgi:tRNA(fMet)-specific endonuclease VapC